MDPELRKKRRRRAFYDHDTSNWKLKGAARPAPIIGAAPFNPHAEGIVTGQDLFALSSAAFCQHPACVEYLRLKCELAQALHNGAGSTKEAIPHYKRCIELDSNDSVKARHGLVRALLDQSAADEARLLMNRFPLDSSAVFTWSLVAIEYISWRLLNEPGSGEEVAAKALTAAYASNPFIAWHLAHLEVFQEVIEYPDDICNPQDGSVEEAIQYVSREAGLWADLEGVQGWLREYLSDNQLSAPAVRGGLPGDAGEMYLSMFETAIAMAAEREQAEAEAAAAAEAAGDDDDDDDDDEAGAGAPEQSSGEDSADSDHDDSAGSNNDD